MGRRKKELKLSEVGKFERIKSNKMYVEKLNSKDKNIIPNSEAIRMEEAKNKKKCEKLIVKTYKQKIQVEQDELYLTLDEKFYNEEEVKNIISELKMKIKDIEYLFRKQWQVLKRFNLQEKIYREESKNLTESEKLKKDEVYKEAIEKLSAAHVAGYEPASVIKNKILNKIQQKFLITDEVMNEFRIINYDHCFTKEAKENRTEFISEDHLLKKRYEDQVGVLEKLIRDNFLVSNKDSKLRDREYDSIHNYHQNKQELKIYEKELEMKAGKGGFYSLIIEEVNETDYNQKFDTPLSANIKVSRLSAEREKSSSYIFEHPMPSKNTQFTEDLNANRYESDNMNVDFDINSEIKFSTDGMSSGKFDKCIRFKDVLKICVVDSITKFKEKIIEEMSEKANYIYEESIRNQKFTYKSKILNDLYKKLTFVGKLSDFDIQILIYLSHVVVKDLVHAKIFGKIYNGLVNPEELLDFLKRFKIELQNNGELFMDGKPLSSQIANLDSNISYTNSNFLKGNQSSYSYLHSEYSKEDN